MMSSVPRETLKKVWPDQVKDHMVSGEVFQLVYNRKKYLLETTPIPSIERLPSYYQSEDYLSHKDESGSFFGKLYMFLRSWSISNKLKLVKRFHKEKGNLLDLGCGTGEFLLAARESGWNASGVEPGEQARGFALEKGLEVDSDWKTLDEGSFDVICLWHVLEHIPELEECCIKLQRLLNPGGTLIIAVPNFQSWDAKHYGSYWAAYDVPRHLWHFSKKSMEVLFKDELELVQIRPMYLDPFYVSLLSEKYKGSNLVWARAILSGVRSIWSGWFSKEHSSHIYILKKPE